MEDENFEVVNDIDTVALEVSLPTTTPSETQPQQKQPKTVQQALLIEALGEVAEIKDITESALVMSQKFSDEINKAFADVESSISALSLQVEESIKKQGDRASATLSLKIDGTLQQMTTRLDVILQQITTYQTDSLGKIREFFIAQGNQLAPEAERTRIENVELAKKEIEAAKQQATKEITVLINRINGDKLESKLIILIVVFSIASALISTSLNYILMNNLMSNLAVSMQQPMQQSSKKK